jgi:hypothetical protein
LRRKRVEMRGGVEVLDGKCNERKLLIASRSWYRVYMREMNCVCFG